ncbi:MULTISPECIES: DUF2459 domain-containing protein [unclassified Roseitalea]|uniref:DUF2459 domain-containing protein n=1 Tax=unclassified Roseitalea TaxID=2639107 RepID=UPI00273FDED8|nr:MULTISPECIES: DUF2459 domain-containing protein [unclassified Roseitalea]
MRGRRFALALVALLPLALVAALVLGTVPLPARAPGAGSAADGAAHRIFVISNGFHSAIALPADATVTLDGGRRGSVEAALGLDMTDFPVDPAQVRYWQFGWGSKVAYTSLRRVRDLTFDIAARALAFDVAVMHVQPLGPLSAGEGVYPVDVSAAQLAALAAGLERSFAAHEPLAGITQGFGDRFYPGAGRFSPVMSCNTWTGRQLRRAGIGVGLWTPFAAQLELSLARVQAR